MAKERKVSVSIGTSMEINGVWFKVSVSEEGKGTTEDFEKQLLGRAVVFLDEAVDELEAFAAEKIKSSKVLE